MNKLRKAAENIIINCFEAQANDRLIIITDLETEKIAKAIEEVANEVVNAVKILRIEDFTQRPAKNIPFQMIKEIERFSPTLSIYAASGKEGELPVFRRPLVDEILVEKHNCIHAHMISIDEQIMLEGMLTDHSLLYDFTMKIYDIVKRVKKIKIYDNFGTEIEAEFSNKLRWSPSHGKLRRSKHWQNLPGTEVFTTPANVNGIVSAFILGDYFIKHRVLPEPVKFWIRNSRVIKVESSNKSLQNELEEYLKADENANRVGEFAFGTNIGIKNIIGNLLQDEKFPGIHMAFGFPYPNETGADWISGNHLDIIPLKVTAEIDGKKILDKGSYVNL